MKLSLRLTLLLNALVGLSVFCSAQSERDFSLAISLDYGFGRYFNNRAGTLSLNYNLFKQLRLSPSFSCFAERNNLKMSAFTFDFIYLISGNNNNLFPSIKNKGIFYYPIFGFCLVNSSGISTYCPQCASYERPNNKQLILNSGFDFGFGVEYRLPMLQEPCRNMSVKCDAVYIFVEDNYRPLLRFGLLYNF